MKHIKLVILGITLGMTLANTFYINKIVCALDRLVQAEQKEVVIIKALAEDVWGNE